MHSSTQKYLGMTLIVQIILIWEVDGWKVLMVDNLPFSHHGLLMIIKHKELLLDGAPFQYYYAQQQKK
jgi:hypothetical protein